MDPFNIDFGAVCLPYRFRTIHWIFTIARDEVRSAADCLLSGLPTGTVRVF
jgi:hypothetical protein